MRVPAATMLAVACLTIAGCGGITDPSKNTVEPFSGTIAVGGTSFHLFSSQRGEISVKMTALAPTSNATVGLTWTQATSDGSCAGLLQQGFSQQLNVPVIAGVIVAGRYCIVLQDVGTFTVPQTYTVAVSHP
jgi:hypothetical protein